MSDKRLPLDQNPVRYILDSSLRHGSVADPAASDPDTVAIRVLARKLRDGQRVDIDLIPLANGLLMARKH
jgi:O-methyltransferase